MAIEFFGDIDKNRNGTISSEMPAWFYDVHLEFLEEEVAKKERQLANYRVPPENAPMVRQEVVDQKARIKAIRFSQPKLGSRQKDTLSNQYHKLQNAIADSMPTRRDDRRGYADARSELKRMKDHNIDVNPELAKACNVSVVGGKVSGDGANRMYKMMGRVLGENENIEKIRREGRSESQRSMEAFTQHALEQVNGRQRPKETS